MDNNQTKIKGKNKKQGMFSVRITDWGSKGLKKSTRRNEKSKSEFSGIIRMLQNDPLAGKELTSDLYGMRAVPSYDNEFRIVYNVNEKAKEIIIQAVGHRHNVYKNLARLLRRVMPYSV